VLQENEPHPLSGWNVGGRPIAVYTLAPGEVGNIISVRRSTTDYFYHYDGMGNVIFMTDTAGNKAAEYVMDSFGNIAYTQGPSVNSYLWRTKEYDNTISKYIEKGNIIKTDSNNSDIGRYKWFNNLSPDVYDVFSVFPYLNRMVSIIFMDRSCNRCLAEKQKEQLKERHANILKMITAIDTENPNYENINKGYGISVGNTDIFIPYNDSIGWGLVKTSWNPFGYDCSCKNHGYYLHEKYHYKQINSHGGSWWELERSNDKVIEKPAYEAELADNTYWLKLAEGK